GFDARVGTLPFRHLVAQVGLDLVGHLLEERAGGTAATGAGGHLRSKAADTEGLENLLGDHDLFGAVAVGHGGQGDADRVADALLQHHGQSGGGGDDALAAHSGFGKAKVQRVVTALAEHAVDVDQVLHAADLGAENDAVASQPVLFGGAGRIERAGDHAFHGDFAGVFGLRQKIVLIHHAG